MITKEQAQTLKHGDTIYIANPTKGVTERVVEKVGRKWLKVRKPSGGLSHQGFHIGHPDSRAFMTHEEAWARVVFWRLSGVKRIPTLRPLDQLQHDPQNLQHDIQAGMLDM